MTEDDARDRVRAIVGDAAMDRLAKLVDGVVAENARQNLVSRSTLAVMWSRHVLDSVQLLPHAPTDGLWLDIGTGGGFPGLAIAAALPSRALVLVEPRRRRADFLREAAATLGLAEVEVCLAKVETVAALATTISARAVAPIEKLLQASRHCATPATRWLFLRGRPAEEEIDALRRQTGLMFHVEQSLSDPSSSIVIAEKVRR